MRGKIVGLIIILAATSSVAEQDVEKTFGSWSKICTAGDGDPHHCQIVQSANQKDTGRRVFHTALGYVDDNDKPILYMTAPLGIFLPRGISIFVDDQPGLRAAVQICDANGCLGLLALEDDFLELLKEGETAKLVFATSAEQNVSVPLDLNGFKKAYASFVRP